MGRPKKVINTVTIDPVEFTKTLLEQVNKLIDIKLQSFSPTNGGRVPETPIHTDIVAERIDNEESQVNSLGKRIVSGKFHNKFVDDRTKHMKDKIFDKKVWGDNQPVPRRKPSRKIQIVCDSCKKNILVYPKNIPPSINEDGFKTFICDQCLGSQG